MVVGMSMIMTIVFFMIVVMTVMVVVVPFSHDDQCAVRLSS